MFFTKPFAFVGMLFVASTLAIPADQEVAACAPGKACFTHTASRPIPCPAISCSYAPGQSKCTNTQTETRNVPPLGSCPTPTVTVDGTCNTNCFACPTTTTTSTRCYTATVTSYTGPVPPCVPCASTSCSTKSTVTIRPTKACPQCHKPVPTITTTVPHTCPSCEGACVATSTVTVPYYNG